MITESKYIQAARAFGLEPAVIKAVAEVESAGNGFLPSGEPVILFEPHIFWRELRSRGIDPLQHVGGNTDILYPNWRPGAYGKYSEQHSKLARAAAIHREAALSSASWGRFQIMGFNFYLCGCALLQEFINRMYRSEDEHLELFLNFVQSKGLMKHLKAKNWASFAYGYNGASYKTNKYHTRLAAAYTRLK